MLCRLLSERKNNGILLDLWLFHEVKHCRSNIKKDEMLHLVLLLKLLLCIKYVHVYLTQEWAFKSHIYNNVKLIEIDCFHLLNDSLSEVVNMSTCNILIPLFEFPGKHLSICKHNPFKTSNNFVCLLYCSIFPYQIHFTVSACIYI
jgi:hypothetical protein